MKKAIYETPEMEIVWIEAEQCFAASMEGSDMYPEDWEL